jgi:hypothetical protein
LVNIRCGIFGGGLREVFEEFVSHMVGAVFVGVEVTLQYVGEEEELDYNEKDKHFEKDDYP